MSGHCVAGAHGDCPDTHHDTGACSCPCHLKEQPSMRLILDAGSDVDDATPTASESPILYLDASGEWSVLLPDGPIVNDRSVASDPTPVNYWPLVTALGALAHTLNADSSDEACRHITALLSRGRLTTAEDPAGSARRYVEATTRT